MENNNKIFKYIHIIMAIIAIFIFYFIYVNNNEKLFILIWFAIAMIFTILRHYYLKKGNNKIIKGILPYFEIIILLIILYLESSSTTIALFIILSMDIALDYGYKYSIIFTISSYLIYMAEYIRHVAQVSTFAKLLLLIIAAMQFTLFTAVANLAKIYALQSNQLKATTAELKTKMISLEQLTLLKERNRIAEEIHNTVGHQLTTALVQIEATQILMDKDLDEAKRRLLIIKEQVRDGLNELRRSIHAINATEEYKDLPASIRALIGQVKNHADVDISLDIEDVEGISIQLKKTIYHIVLESITNGIRHGQCRKIYIKLSREVDRVNIQSFNDGILPKDLKYGYGLSQIKENLKSIGGTLLLKINDDGWFGLIVNIPIYYREGDASEEDKGYAGG